MQPNVADKVMAAVARGASTVTNMVTGVVQ